MLLSIGASAQNGATLKGDVNGDGKIDVEDVTSLVDIILSGKTYGYFYFGTTQPTVENYQTLSGVVATYTSIGDAVGATVSVDAGETLYMLCPAAWMKGKKVDLEDGAGNTYKFIEIIDAETVPGYVIYSTQAWNEATDLTLNFEITGGDEYFWYVGQTEVTEDNFDDLVEKVSYESSYEYTNPGPRGYTWIVLHKDRSIESIIGTSTGGRFTPIEQNTIGDYKIYRTGAAVGINATIRITIN